MTYYKRQIDRQLAEWKDSPRRKPLLIRGARQVGKSTAVRELGKQFRYFVEINLEKQPDLLQMFPENIDVKRTCEKLSGTLGIPIVPGETLLFIDEIQISKEAVMSLRYFKEGLSGTARHCSRLSVGVRPGRASVFRCRQNTFALYVPLFV